MIIPDLLDNNARRFVVERPTTTGWALVLDSHLLHFMEQTPLFSEMMPAIETLNAYYAMQSALILRFSDTHGAFSSWKAGDQRFFGRRPIDLSPDAATWLFDLDPAAGYIIGGDYFTPDTLDIEPHILDTVRWFQALTTLLTQLQETGFPYGLGWGCDAPKSQPLDGNLPWMRSAHALAGTAQRYGTPTAWDFTTARISWVEIATTRAPSSLFPT